MYGLILLCKSVHVGACLLQMQENNQFTYWERIDMTSTQIWQDFVDTLGESAVCCDIVKRCRKLGSPSIATTQMKFEKCSWSCASGQTIEDVGHEKRSEQFYKGVPLHHDKSHPVTAGFELVENPPYSPDLAHSNFPLFPKSKITYEKKDFLHSPQAMMWFVPWMPELNNLFFLSGSRNAKTLIGKLC